MSLTKSQENGVYIMNNATITTTVNEYDIHVAAIDASDLIVKKFQEIFKTETMTKVEGSLLFTLMVGVNRWGNPLISLYTIGIGDTVTPYRYTTIQWDILSNGDVYLGMSDSMTVKCRELANFIESIGDEFYYRDHFKRVEKYITRGN